MHRIVTGGLVSALAALSFAAAANGAPLDLRRSGNVYSVAACPRVSGLNARCFARIVSDSAGKIISHAAPPVSGYGPSDLRDAYKVTADGSSSTIVALVDAYGYDNAEADLGTYRSFFGLPKCTTNNGCFKKLNQEGQQGNYPTQNIGWAQESALDMDMASAMCPNCKIILVEATASSYNDLAASENTAANQGAHVISNSYGGGEGGTQSYEPSYNHRNVAVTASTGDSGYGVQFPASSPHVIAVGGTVLTHDSGRRGWKETVWPGAGSGCSTVYTKPSWQTDSGCSKRMVADTAADASPGTGVAVYGPNNSGVSQWLVFGGTSVAAPLVGGIYGVNGGKVKYASKLYRARMIRRHEFDVTTGSNGTCNPNPPYFCNGEVGYDGPTGNGTPNGIKAY